MLLHFLRRALLLLLNALVGASSHLDEYAFTAESLSAAWDRSAFL